LEAFNIPVSAATYALAQDFLKTLSIDASAKTHRAALHRFFAFLDTQRVPLPGDEPSGYLDQRLQHYQHYLQSVCGLAPTTCNKRLQLVGTFLGWLAHQGSELDALPIPAFIHYFSDYGRTHTPGSTQCLTYVIRHYLRYEQLQGHPTGSLIAAIPKIAPWPLSALPIPLSEVQLEQFLAAFDRSTPAGLRDYAMARCLVDLRLRASEVAALCLEDNAWQSGCIGLAAGKNRRAARLPLPPQTGDAIVAYLQRGRPPSPSRVIFLPRKAPYDAPPTVERVRGAMRRAYARAGFPITWTGTHRLRHTTATRMLQHGASLKAIADVLRHGSLDTTKHYTHVDIEPLRTVSMPWPGATS
jgi:site-specific recombinase XerD